MWSSGRRPGQHCGQQNLRVPAGPNVRQQVQAELPRVAAALHKAQVRQHAVHGLNAVRRAQDGQGEGGVAARCACVLCARLRLKNQRRQLGAPGVLHDAGGYAALQTRGLRALPQNLPASPAPRGPARRCRLRRASPSAASRKSRAPSARRWPLYSWLSASHHLVLLRKQGAKAAVAKAVAARDAAWLRSGFATWMTAAFAKRVPIILSGRVACCVLAGNTVCALAGHTSCALTKAHSRTFVEFATYILSRLRRLHIGALCGHSSFCHLCCKPFSTLESFRSRNKNTALAPAQKKTKRKEQQSPLGFFNTLES